MEDDTARLEPRVARRLEVLTTTMAEGFKAIDARFEKMDAKMDARFDKVDAKIDKVDAKIDKVDAKFEGKLDALSKRRFALLIALLSATATLVAAILGVLLSASHTH